MVVIGSANILVDQQRQLGGRRWGPAGEMAAVLARNPFPGEPGNRTVALFVDDPLSRRCIGPCDRVAARAASPGRARIYIFYGNGMAASRLRIPEGNAETARNMNTIAKLVKMATGL